ncbi:nucleoside-diphosphate-sugar epimerase [Glaciihabitans tibetensis]|uniref:Nucleoside-diphosphate-sugar epimerase n=1 Tax=Glaciihabitans tibetensis TaxID=1266600 RepID=A0A2T0VHT6_9MICO|nr:NAD-dependent epimerase/dehydratase family protein [Glaciihabitans tibetensis]PRY69633.1 nucleoside-diphosphate-sugar epimerase [Glaciihabitans tibetensis]
MTVLIAGCGDIGTEVGLRFAALGSRVVGLRRSARLLPAGIEGQSVDLTVERPSIPTDTDTVIVALAAGSPTPEAYRAVYVDGLRNVLDALDEAGVTPRRMLLVSSTAVFSVSDGSWVDENTAAVPVTETAAILLEAEQLLHARQPSAVVLRLTGIYGPGRERLITQVRAGRATVSARSAHTNRIHRDDAAAAIVHLMTMGQPTAPLYLGVDNQPVRSAEVLEFLANELGAAKPQLVESTTERGGDKLCSNALLRATGFEFTYPDYRSGYRALLAGQGRRHP